MNCRVCLQNAEYEKSIKIFNSTGDAEERSNVANILRQHFWFKPKRNDSSTVVCNGCWVKVKDFHEFYVEVERAHMTLGQKNFNDSVKGEDSVESMMLPLDVEVNIKEEFFENVWAEDGNLLEDDDEEEKTVEAGPITENPLYEPEMIPDNLIVDNDKDIGHEKIGTKKDTTKIDDNEESSNDSVPLSSCTRSKRQYKRSVDNVRESSDNDNNSAAPSQAKQQKQQKRKMITKNDDEMVKKHIPMGCDLCTFVGEDFNEMTNHFRIQHKDKKPYVMCCQRKLSKRFLIIQHAYKHEDPEFFKCKDCNKIFSDSYVLRTHINAAHPQEHQLKFQCDECPRRFARQYLLQLHKPSHIPVNERKFVCDKCPDARAFASDHLLQIHTSMRHTRATNVCHVCAKEIRDKQAFEKHVRLHFEDSGPRVKCPRPDCDRWLKDEDNLKQHLRRHNDEGKIFKCTECSKLCKNRRSLKSHFNYAHTNTVFTCEECNKTFKKAITLKEHMAQHTGESLYRCPFCPRTFNSHANMHSHKKKMHPAEWDLWRKTKRGSAQQVITKSSMDNVVKYCSNQGGGGSIGGAIDAGIS